MQWKYYNHAAIPTTAPHEEVDLTSLKDGSVWKLRGGHNEKPLLARWTSDFDCGKKTEWWYIIQDNPIVLENLKKSHRRKINKGLNNFTVKVINPSDYAGRMAEITIAMYQTYPKKYRPSANKEDLTKSYQNPQLGSYPNLFFGAFNNDGLLCGFDHLIDFGSYWDMAFGKVDPEWERQYELNAAMMYTEIDTLREDLLKGKYLTNGSRNLNHETNLNEDLIHYYGFRKAYCKLHMAYKPGIGIIVKTLYPFRRLLCRFDEIGIFHQINSIMRMEEIARGFK